MTSSRKLKILFVTPEVVPFVKTGGVADVSSSLPQILHEMGHQVRIVVPKYGTIDERKYKIHEVVRLKDLCAKVGDKDVLFSIRSSFLIGQKARVQIYFLDNNEYFGKRHSLYMDPLTKEDFPDNDERFALFSKAVIELILKLGWIPDIIHCNDWQTALIPVYLKTVYNNEVLLKNIRTIFTIHNMSYQGEFPKTTFNKLGFPESLNTENGLLNKSKINYLKGGLLYSDIINTVSERYAQEIIQDKEISCGLNKTLLQNNTKVYGIINGIDNAVWNPDKDKLITKKYNSKHLTDKVENRIALADKFGLAYDEKAPIIGMITKLVDIKGLNLLQEIFHELMELNLRLIILGTGEKKYHKFFEEVFMQYPDKFSCYLGFDDELAHMIEAGSDIFLMPSLYEPCGLNQMYSLIYGTIPVVRETGGLADTVFNFNENAGEGNGFVFKKFNSKEMLKEIKRAVKIYQTDKTMWGKIIQNAMKSKFEWSDSAKKYIELYKKALNS